MRRHEALHPFSRDHSVGLVLARRLMREDAATALLEGWDLELRDHFSQEENLLGPLIADPGIRDRFMSDHVLFEAFVDRIRAGERSLDVQCEAGRLLDEHIRWEERVLFPHVEEEATAEQLAGLKAGTDLIEAERANCPLEPKRGRIVARRNAR
jgi:hypothetical protein